MPIGERALVWIERYLQEARPKLAREPDDGTLYLTVDGEPFSLDRLTQLARGYVVASGVQKQGACHLFRHTLATLMLEGGADIRYIQQMLGHVDISTTQIYTQVSIRHLQAIRAATHPAAANTPRSTRPPGGAGRISEHDGGAERHVAISELLAALDSEDQEEDRDQAGS